MTKLTKFAIIADIHANKYALESFLNYLDDYFPAEKILNIGDFVHIGPHPREVVETIVSDNRFVNVIGNNDLIVMGKRKEEWPNGILPHREWTVNQIGDELMEKLLKFPDYYTFSSNNKNILMIHSHFYNLPDRKISDNILLYQGKPLEEFIRDYPEDSDIIFLGHTHEQMYLYKDGKIIVNPGSLSITRKPLISFCLMEFNTEEVNIIFKNIKYDLSNLENDYIKRNVPGKDFLLQYFYPFLK